jgi:hypothetical protein
LCKTINDVLCLGQIDATGFPQRLDSLYLVTGVDSLNHVIGDFQIFVIHF